MHRAAPRSTLHSPALTSQQVLRARQRRRSGSEQTGPSPPSFPAESWRAGEGEGKQTARTPLTRQEKSTSQQATLCVLFSFSTGSLKLCPKPPPLQLSGFPGFPSSHISPHMISSSSTKKARPPFSESRGLYLSVRLQR